MGVEGVGAHAVAVLREGVRFGNLVGAWCAIIFGSGTSLLGLVFQQNWAISIYPFIERHGWVGDIDIVLRRLSAPFMPWIDWKMDAVKFPINSYEIFFISMVLAVIGYVAGSLLTYKPYDLDKLLHRGKYNDGESTLKGESWSWRNVWEKLIGITSEYSLGDKLTAWFVFFYSFVWQVGVAFFSVLILNIFHPMPDSWWGDYLWVVTLAVPGAVSVFTTVWFFIGGILDLRRLFVDLGKRVEAPEDNGQVQISGSDGI